MQNVSGLYSACMQVHTANTQDGTASKL